MKYQTLLCSFLLFATPLLADVELDTQNVGSENIQQPAKRTPFSFETHIDYVTKAKIDKKGRYGDHIHFAEAQVEAGMVVYYNPTYTEGARIALGFTPTYIKWSKNPWFEQDHFNLVNLSVAAFTKRLDHWFWRTQITANIDTSEWNSRYTSYDWIVWGRYAYNCNLGFHFGFWAETGLHMDRVYPILGFDWQITKKLKLNAVFPVDIALMYSINQKWSIGAAARFFDSRFRVKQKQHSLMPLFRYMNTGAELIAKYETPTTSANIHAGSTLAGYVRVANKNNHHAKHYDIDPAFYVGAEMDVKF